MLCNQCQFGFQKRSPVFQTKHSRKTLQIFNGKSALDEIIKLRQEAKEEETEQVVTNLQWKSPLKIIKYPNPILRAKNLKIRDFNDDRVQKLAEEMFEIMYQDDGVGLAAPQVGVNVRMMVFNETGNIKLKQYQEILVNPYIVSKKKKTEVGEEGCLSFPKIFADVERSVSVKIKAQNEKGEWVRREYVGWPAIIFQHEYDHLEGTLFHDRMSTQEFSRIKDLLIEMEEDFRKKNPGVQFQSVQ